MTLLTPAPKLLTPTDLDETHAWVSLQWHSEQSVKIDARGMCCSVYLDPALIPAVITWLAAAYAAHLGREG